MFGNVSLIAYCFFHLSYMALSEHCQRLLSTITIGGAVGLRGLKNSFASLRSDNLALPNIEKYTYRKVRINLLTCSKHRLLSQLHNFGFTYISSRSGMDRDKCYTSPEFALMICSARGILKLKSGNLAIHVDCRTCGSMSVKTSDPRE